MTLPRQGDREVLAGLAASLDADGIIAIETVGVVDGFARGIAVMHNEFTAIIERDGEWIVAYSPELPGANGQGHTREEALESLADAIALILEDRREDGLRGVPDSAERTVVTVE